MRIDSAGRRLPLEAAVLALPGRRDTFPVPLVVHTYGDFLWFPAAFFQLRSGQLDRGAVRLAEEWFAWWRSGSFESVSDWSGYRGRTVRSGFSPGTARVIARYTYGCWQSGTKSLQPVPSFGIMAPLVEKRNQVKSLSGIRHRKCVCFFSTVHRMTVKTIDRPVEKVKKRQA